jgi:hypothetical protein
MKSEIPKNGLQQRIDLFVKEVQDRIKIAYLGLNASEKALKILELPAIILSSNPL